MEKERRVKVLSLVALIVAVLGLTVAFAALSQTLTINGTASVDAAEWDIHFESIETVNNNVRGSAKELSEPVIEDGTKVSGVNVSLSKPGDSIYYKIKVVNSGTIDATYNNYSLNGMIIKAEYANDDDLISKACISSGFGNDEEQCILSWAKNMYSSADWDGDGVTTDEEYLKASENIIVSDWDNSSSEFLSIDYHPDLNAGESKYLGFYIGYGIDCTEVPKGNISINIDFIAGFSQK